VNSIFTSFRYQNEAFHFIQVYLRAKEKSTNFKSLYHTVYVRGEQNFRIFKKEQKTKCLPAYKQKPTYEYVTEATCLIVE
jgi:hypothetical protein